MKNLLYLFLAICVSSVSFGQTTLIPDPNFEQALIDLGHDTPPIDGSVPTNNIWSIFELDISNRAITDLTGIEDFGALGILDCSLNALVNLDMSENWELEILDCSNNQLTNLDLPEINGNALTELYCWGNQLTSLDVSNNPSLSWLWCYTNQLISLDVRNGNNTNILGIDYFDSSDNPNLTCIYVDDVEYSSQNWPNIDPNSTFVENEAECALDVADNSLDVDLILYPNPTDNYLFIQGTTSHLSATVYNMLGKQVLFAENTEKIDMSGLSDGVYIIKISDGVNETQRKFIKN